VRAALVLSLSIVGTAVLAAAPSHGQGGCPANLAASVKGAGTAEQLITVEAARFRTTAASLRLWRRQGKCWIPAAGPWPARVGWNGISRNRREGDGTTPAGVFTIGPTMYGNAPDPGVRYRYRRLACGDWWNEDARSPTYNSFQHVRCGTSPPFRTTTPGLWESKRAYRHFAVIEFNMHPVVPGRGSGIFLHAQTGSSTNGCVSLPAEKLVAALRWLRPAARPRIAIGTTGSLHG
jgi:L,D-peptidoglycan transpeptidase YkuD (ErfK/YbiS/YcfS/YnhG family)